MKLNTSAAILTALTLIALPAVAGQHQRHDQNRSADATRSQDNTQNNRAQDRATERRPDAPRETPRAQAPRAEAPRAADPPQVESQRADTNRRQGDHGQRQSDARQHDGHQNDNRRNGNRQSDNRQYDRRSDYGRRDSGQAIPRVAPRRDDDNRYRGSRPIIIAPRYYGSRGYYAAPYRGYRPYYFRPWTQLSFGIYRGYSVPYVYSYAYPVPVYGYDRPPAPVMIGPSSPYYGGVSLEISPSDGEVFVDGTYAGYVEDFDGTQQPLTLTAGAHRIEIRAPGYEALVLDVNVNPGEVVPYRGDMLPYRY